jgi:hypothetical protein
LKQSSSLAWKLSVCQFRPSKLQEFPKLIYCTHCANQQNKIAPELNKIDNGGPVPRVPYASIKYALKPMARQHGRLSWRHHCDLRFTTSMANFVNVTVLTTRGTNLIFNPFCDNGKFQPTAMRKNVCQSIIIILIIIMIIIIGVYWSIITESF